MLILKNPLRSHQRRKCRFNAPSGKRGLGQIGRRRGALLDPGRIIDHPSIIDLLPRAFTTHFEATDMLDDMFGRLDRELMVPLAGRPLLGCEGGPIVHSFILRGV